MNKCQQKTLLDRSLAAWFAFFIFRKNYGMELFTISLSQLLITVRKHYVAVGTRQILWMFNKHLSIYPISLCCKTDYKVRYVQLLSVSIHKLLLQHVVEVI